MEQPWILYTVEMPNLRISSKVTSSPLFLHVPWNLRDFINTTDVYSYPKIAPELVHFSQSAQQNISPYVAMLFDQLSTTLFHETWPGAVLVNWDSFWFPKPVKSTQ